MFGPNREEIQAKIDSAISALREDFERRLKRMDVPPSAKELAGDALRELTASVNAKEFLKNLLLTKGLTIEGLVRSAVAEEVGRSDAIKDVIEQAVSDIENVDMGEIYEKTAERLATLIMKEHKDDLIRECAEQLVDPLYDATDINELHLVIGEKVLEMLRRKEK